MSSCCGTFFLLKTCLIQGEKKEIPQCCTMAFHGKCEQGSTNPAQGAGDTPREGSITVSFGQAGSLFGVIYRSMGEALLMITGKGSPTGMLVKGCSLVRVYSQKCGGVVTYWSLDEGFPTGAGVNRYSQELGCRVRAAWVAQRWLHHQNIHSHMGED